MNNKEKEVGNGVGTKGYLDEDGQPQGRFTDPTASDYEFSLIGSPKNVLEIGIGTGRDIKKFNDLGIEVNGIDISETFINLSKDKYKGKFVVGDARDISSIFEGSTFDLIYSRGSIIHFSIQDLQKLMSELPSVLSDKGIFLVSLRGGDDYNQINGTTKIRSLQMNKEKLYEILPETLEVVHTEKRPVKTTQSDNDFAFTFVLKKK